MKIHVKTLFITVVVLALALAPGGLTRQNPTHNRQIKHHVYVAFGFHVNLYHSYRVDRNDEGGFGKDIRVIRSIIKSLDQANRGGVPAKAAWDMDNLFSLQRFLPDYAPDIISDIKRRIDQRGDEVILMSYNNAMASTLNGREFDVSIKKAITNEEGSGVLDLFGEFTPIVRPQEMMVGPGCYQKYRDLGMDAVVLYYSAITFDAFRLFSRPLSRTEAFNPIRYKNDRTGENITVIPAYNIGDLLENGSLSRMAEKLHQEQTTGKIDGDVLIFINFDADDEFWTGYDLPWRLSFVPNTGGLKGLIREAAGLEYVKFTTPGEYLKDHLPVGEVNFGQDLADGNFNGYNNWAEKPLASETWTAVEHDRRVHEMAENTLNLADLDDPPDTLSETLDEAFRLRLELLSSTNFGMSVPDVAPARRRVVRDTIAKLAEADRTAMDTSIGIVRERLEFDQKPITPEGLRWLDSFYLLGRNKDGGPGIFITFDLTGESVRKDECLYITGPDGNTFRPVWVDDEKDGDRIRTVKLYIPDGAALSIGPYHVLAGAPDAPGFARPKAVWVDKNRIQNETIKVAISPRGRLEGVYKDGRRVLDANGLMPLISYRTGKGVVDYRPEKMSVNVIQDGMSGAGVVRLSAELDLPGLPVERRGRVDYFLTLLSGVPYLFVEANVQYPQTTPETMLSGGHPSLTGFIDRNWIQVAPAELKPVLTADRSRPFHVQRKNYLGVESSYPVDYYKHSSGNLNMAEVNNHIAAEYVAVTGLEGGLALAADSTVLADFAFCPITIKHHVEDDRFSLRLNPLGTYFGPQFEQPSWGDGLGYKTALAAGGQYYSSAPGYNAVSQTFSLMLAFFDGPQPPDSVKRDLTVFSHRPELITGGRIGPGRLNRRLNRPTSTPLKMAATSDESHVFFNWTNAAGSVSYYKVYCGRESGRYDNVWATEHLSLETAELQQGRKYYAAVTAVDPAGKESPKSEEVEFVPGQGQSEQTVKLPIRLQLRLMTAGLTDWLRKIP